MPVNLNKVFVIERGQYDELGMLMAAVTVLGLVLPVVTVILVNTTGRGVKIRKGQT